ncbi:amidohydrolase family protein [Halorubrum vacuolatum]|uniref:5-methylthioadenosine/S-adenosylhomocysteine deaminase n=1 Tax=Halorubrum vacuolatum TaxID=63740 RepID=A0A238WMC2_HALVU|nr:amidohydrolase family protein [Halorubrum vacuolatum]SNR47568.1 5-methylthioadenosine/S-adenosylhomocysteine deaminase [Halorubrum vacuolatum]
MDALITDTLLVSMDPGATGGSGELGIVDRGAVGWTDGELTYVGPTEAIDPNDAARTIDGDGCLTLPGFVNAHVHGRYSVIRGAAQDVPEIEWMDRALDPIGRHVSAEDGIVGAKLTALEAIAAGTTTLGEYAADVATLVDRVYRPFGLRVVATETINEVPGDREDLDPNEPFAFDRDAGREALDRTEALFERYGDDPLVVPAYGPQALDMVSMETLTAVFDRAREQDRTVHVHVAQGERERRAVAARYGEDATTVGVLDREGFLGDHLLAAHLHGATTAERKRLATAGVRMVGCPSSIAAIDGIVPPIVEYREHGGTVGIGTDQAPGTGGHNTLRELRTAALLAKVDRRDPTALDAPAALKIATIGGARALGIDDVVGSLAPGKRADVVVCDLDAVGVAPTAPEPFHTAIPNLVYGTAGAEVRDVFVDGVQLVSAGGIVGVDVDDVVVEANERAERIFADAEEEWRAAGSTLVDDVDAGRL